MHQLATQQLLTKGECVVVEGDLYQRIYIVVSGELHMKKKGKHLVTLRDGEVFGYLRHHSFFSLFFFPSLFFFLPFLSPFFFSPPFPSPPDFRFRVFAFRSAFRFWPFIFEK
jgi:hypothetical protein